MAAGADRPPWQVRIRWSPEGVPEGGGVLCGERWVLTCAHVTAPGATPPEEVWVDFPFAGVGSGGGAPIKARVLPESWHPASGDGGGDVVLLELSGDPPTGTRPAPMAVPPDQAGHRFGAYGFPQGHDNGVWARGEIEGRAHQEWIQLVGDAGRGHLINRGFSGSPVWDEKLRAVTGIVVCRDRDISVRGGYAIGLDVVASYLPGLGNWVRWRVSRDPDFVRHWDPEARGVDRASRPGWYFTGRQRALEELVDWISNPGCSGLRVVTGGPGSGKSALLAWLLVLGDPLLRDRIARERPEVLANAAVTPPVGWANVAARARGLDRDGVASRFGEGLSIPADGPEDLTGAVGELGRVTVVLDGLDEAVSADEAEGIARNLLVPLAVDTETAVLVGTRRGQRNRLVNALGRRAVVIDLDDPAYFDLDDVALYASALLRGDHDPKLTSPYLHDPAAAEAAAGAIASAASPSFLVAGLAARAWADDVAVIDITRPGWQARERFPPDVEAAMGAYLARLPDPQRALALLVPLAFAHPPGLPRDTLWPALASTYTGSSVGAAEITAFLDSAAAYLIETTATDDQAVVTLFHQALIGYVRTRALTAVVERIFITELSEQTHAAGGWLHADSYARRHMVTHAAAVGGELLNNLVRDPAFLVAADRAAMLRALPCVSTAEAKSVGRCYRAAAHALSTDMASNAAYLELEARAQGRSDLADQFRDLDLVLPFTTVLAVQEQRSDSVTLAGDPTGITALAWGEIDGRPVLASGGNDNSVRLWDPATAEPQETSLTGHTGSLTALAWGEIDGRPVLASAGWDHTVRLWDPATTEPLRILLSGNSKLVVVALAWGEIDGRPVLASADWDSSAVSLWDPATGERLGELPEDGVITALAWGEFDGRPVLASAGWNRDRAMWLWDLTVGEALEAPLTGDTSSVTALAWGEINGRPVLASASSYDVRLWDPATARLLGALTGHTGPVTALVWGELDGRSLLVGAGEDNTVRLWDLAVAEPVATPSAHADWPRSARLTTDAGYYVTALAWGEIDGHPMLASGSEDHTVWLWDLATARPWRDLTGHTEKVTALVWGEVNGHPMLASGSRDMTVRLWDPTTARPWRDLTGHTGEITALVWGEVNGHPMLASSCWDETVRLWDPTTAKLLGELTGHTSTVTALAWGEIDGRPVLASGSKDKTVRFWDLATTEPLGKLTGRTGDVTALAWGEIDGHAVLASGSKDKTVLLWDPARERGPVTSETDPSEMWLAPALADLRTRRTVQPTPGVPFIGHTDEVTALAWAEIDGRPVLASASTDNTVRLWDPSTRLATTILRFAAVNVVSICAPLIAVGQRTGLTVVRMSPATTSD